MNTCECGRDCKYHRCEKCNRKARNKAEQRTPGGKNASRMQGRQLPIDGQAERVAEYARRYEAGLPIFTGDEEPSLFSGCDL